MSALTTGLPKPIGWTPLRFLVNNNCAKDAHRLKMITMLIEVKADTESRMGNDGVCVLGSATSTGNVAAVDKLIELRADVMVKNTTGSTLVDYAWSNDVLKQKFLQLGVEGEVGDFAEKCKTAVNGWNLAEGAQ